jgi:hypothetical protein
MNNTLISTISNHRPRLFNNPVILREIIDRLRKKSSFISFSIFLGIVTVLFFCLLPSLQATYYSGGSINSRELFMVFNAIQGIIILVLVPLFSATCINIERERCSWDLLITTPISIPSILLAKFLSPIVLTIIMASSLIPIYGLIITLGGVSPGEIIFTFAIFLELAITASLIGLYCSIKWKSSIISIYFTYLFLVILYIVLPFFIFSIRFELGFQTIGPLIFFSPLMSTIHFIDGRIGSYSIETALVYHGLIASFIGLIIAYFCVRALISQTIHYQAAYSIKFKRFIPRFIPTLFKTAIYYFNRIFLSSRNTFVRKEILSHNGPSGSRVAKSLLILLAINLSFLSLIIMTNSRHPIETYLVISIFVGLFLVPFLVVPCGVNCIRSEFDKDSWSLLTTTELTPLQILKGKYMTSTNIFIYQAITYFFLPLILAFNQNHNITFNFIEISIVLVALFAAANFYLMLSTLISLYIRETLTAYGVSFFAVFSTIIIPVVTSIILMDMQIISNSTTDNNFAILFSSAISPLMLSILLVERNSSLNQFLLFLPVIVEIFSLLFLTYILKSFAIARLKKIMNL